MTTTLHSYTVVLNNAWGYKHPHTGTWERRAFVDVKAASMDEAFAMAVILQEPDPRKRYVWTEVGVQRHLTTS